MSAFNWILMENHCPACDARRNLVAQTHVASDYDGDESGRFHDSTYRLGERMRWWLPAHFRYASWRDGNKIDKKNLAENEELECCYTKCNECLSELYSIIRFVDVSPVEIMDIGFESDWPVSYYR